MFDPLYVSNLLVDIMWHPPFVSLFFVGRGLSSILRSCLFCGHMVRTLRYMLGEVRRLYSVNSRALPPPRQGVRTRVWWLSPAWIDLQALRGRFMSSIGFNHYVKWSEVIIHCSPLFREGPRGTRVFFECSAVGHRSCPSCPVGCRFLSDKL
jgi:hypothetical protein